VAKFIRGEKMTELQNALYSDNQHQGYAIGNWRSHIIIDCAQCHKPMASHNTGKAICNNCKANNLKEGE